MKPSSLQIDNWRWADVPLYLPHRQAPARSQHPYRHPVPPCSVLFRDTPVENLMPNQLVLHIQPEEGISLRFAAKVPGPAMRLGAVDMNFEYSDYFGSQPSTGYERLLHDCMIGDATLFQRCNMVEAGWCVVSPVRYLKHCRPAISLTTQRHMGAQRRRGLVGTIRRPPLGGIPRNDSCRRYRRHPRPACILRVREWPFAAWSLPPSFPAGVCRPGRDRFESCRHVKSSSRRGVFGIAGPVRNGRVSFLGSSNRSVLRMSSKKAILINDLEANAWGIPALEAKDVVALNKVKGQTVGNQAVIHHGHWIGRSRNVLGRRASPCFRQRRRPWRFCPRNPLEVELFNYLRIRFGHVSSRARPGQCFQSFCATQAVERRHNG